MPKESVSFFEICGPVMIGPSSSHTAGVARLGFFAQKMFGVPPRNVLIKLYGSLALTGKGHNSDEALIAGLLGINSEDERVSRGRAALAEARSAGRGFSYDLQMIPELPAHWHPNTLVLELSGANGERLKFRGSSVGGGAVSVDEIDGYQVALSGELESLIVLHSDEVGVIALVSGILADYRVNIAATSSHRKEKGAESLMVVETDDAIPPAAILDVQSLRQVLRVIHVPAIT
jgi:L-serine dehydratase